MVMKCWMTCLTTVVLLSDGTLTVANGYTLIEQSSPSLTHDLLEVYGAV